MAVQAVGTYALVVLTGWIGLRLSEWTANVSPIWPATGCATGLLVWFGLRLWPAVFLGVVTTELLVPYPLLLSSGLAVGATLEAALGAWIILRLPSQLQFLDRLTRPASVIVAGLAAPLISAGWGVQCLRLAEVITPKLTGQTMLTWWSGDVIGFLLFAPLFLPVQDDQRPYSRQAWFTRGSLLAGVTMLVAWLVFIHSKDSSWLFLTLPVLLLAVFLLGSWGARISCLLFSGVSIAATTHGSSPFAISSPVNGVLLLSLFLGILAITAQVLPAFPSRDNRLVIPSVLLLCGWAFSAGMHAHFKGERIADDDFRFTKAIAETENAISRSMSNRIAILRGAAGLAMSLDTVDQTTWSAYVRALQLPANHPGVVGLGLVRPVDGKLLVACAEPATGPAWAPGRDLATDPHYLAAARLARDTGEPQMTRQVGLEHQGLSPLGFLVFLPVYDTGVPLNSVAARQQALRGWVFAPFITHIFMKSVKGSLDHSTGLHLFDSETADPARLMYAADPPAPGAPWPRLEKTTAFTLAGRRLTCGWIRDAKFAHTSTAPELWAGSSLALVSLLLASLVMNLEAGGRRAQRLADTRTHELRESNTRLQAQIVARTHVEASLLRARDAAEAASRAKGEFLATMSHELRTPMNSVLGFSELLQSSVKDPKHAEWIRLQRQSGEALLGIISSVLDFSKIEAGRLELSPAPLDFRALVDQVIQSFTTQAATRQLDLTVEYTGPIPATLTGDVGRIRQILTNLVGNALKFTDTGGVRVSVTWQPGAGGDGLVHLAVTDTGLGIAPADQARLFQMFTQVDSSNTRRFGGTGLGLAISRRLVELMGGKIGVISEPGHGSTFWFDLPLGRATPAAAPDQPAPARTLAGLRVLVADDDAMNRIVAESFLQSIGCRAVLVSGGQEALDTLSRDAFDVLLLDCRMPDLDGYQVARELRHRERGGRRLPIIGLTANALPEDRQRCLEAGMDEYLTKPFKILELQQLLALFAPGSSSPSRAG